MTAGRCAIFSNGECVITARCSLQLSRSANGTIEADPDKFPSGIKALADYVHSLGLQFGIYSDAGVHTVHINHGSF
jgi:hypothetical protein